MTTRMKRAQAIKFWKALADSTNQQEVLSSFENKKGYASSRTLQRFAEADALFKKGAPTEDVAKKTRWSASFVVKIRSWWKEEFGETNPLFTPPIGEAAPKEFIGPKAVADQPAVEDLAFRIARVDAIATELKRHWDELEDLGKRLKEISFPLPLDATALSPAEKPLNLWSSKSRAITGTKGWKLGAYDIRAEELYPFFHQHLAGNACWTVLQQVEQQFWEYRDACTVAYHGLLQEVKGLLPAVSSTNLEAILEAMADSLFTDACYRAGGTSGIIFSYEPKTEDGLHWYLQLGGWSTGSCETPELLEPLARFHKKLSRVLYKRAKFKNIMEKRATGSQTIRSFREALSPDARLRNLIREGHCDHCPRPVPQAIVPNAQAPVL